MKTPKPETALILRTCNADLTSHGGFQWPSEIGAVVTAPDWRDDDECGYGSTLTGGEKAELRIRKWCSKAERYRTHIAYVGEDGIEPEVAYRLDENNKFVKA